MTISAAGADVARRGRLGRRQEPGGERDLRRQHHRQRGSDREREQPGRGDVRPGANEAEEDGVSDPGRREHEERRESDPPGSVRRQLVGEASGDQLRLAEAPRVSALAQVIRSLREDSPPPRAANAHGAELGL
jgi:hypothetical protein